jgi:hypothetical protein
VLQVDQTATLDFTMSVGPVKQVLAVVANLSPVDSTTSKLGTVITAEPVNDLLLNGRNFTQLLALTRGVSPISVALASGLSRTARRAIQRHRRAPSVYNSWYASVKRSSSAPRQEIELSQNEYAESATPVTLETPIQVRLF